MKQPRTSDFDPSAKERKLKSSMEDFPAIEKPSRCCRQIVAGSLSTPRTPRTGRTPLPSLRQAERSNHVTRSIFTKIRYEELKKLAVEDRMRGGSGSMSAMVREAIDEYIAKVRAE